MGAICKDCNQDMLKAKGCTFTHVKIKGRWRARSREHFGEPGGRCNDCGAQHGQPHHYGCDVERCPVCGGQFIGCDCMGYKVVLGIRESVPQGSQTRTPA